METTPANSCRIPSGSEYAKIPRRTGPETEHQLAGAALRDVSNFRRLDAIVSGMVRDENEKVAGLMRDLRSGRIALDSYRAATASAPWNVESLRDVADAARNLAEVVANDAATIRRRGRPAPALDRAAAELRFMERQF